MNRYIRSKSVALGLSAESNLLDLRRDHCRERNEMDASRRVHLFGSCPLYLVELARIYRNGRVDASFLLKGSLLFSGREASFIEL